MSRVYDLVAPILGAGTVIALLGVLVFLLLGRFYKYWPVLAYVVWELMATLGFTIADVWAHGTTQQASGASMSQAQIWYARLYWTNDLLVDLFRFVLVIILIYMASKGSRLVSGHILAAIVLVMLILPFVLFAQGWRPVQVGSITIQFPRTEWLRNASELMNFGAAIMNLILWATLLGSRRRDPQLLVVSLGLGIVVAGTALAYGVRYFLGQHEIRAVAGLILNLTQLFGWLLWCRAFWPAAKARQRMENSVASSEFQ